MDLIIVNSINEIKEKLDVFGVCIVPNVLTEELCDDTINNMIWSFEELTSRLDQPFILKQPDTWCVLEKLIPHHNMLYQHFGLGQRPYIWKNIRTNPEIIKCFSSIWNTDKLICSMDGVALHLPSEMSGSNYYQKENKDRYHFDQSLLKTNFDCVQGLVNARDTNKGDATLTVLARSHLYFEQYSKYKIEEYCSKTPGFTEESIKKEFSGDWFRTSETKFFTDKQCFELKIQCSAGSLVLWDSRVAHYGCEPDKIRQQLNFRCVVYICMVPSERYSEGKFKHETISNKALKIVTDNRQTNHWPHKRKVFPEFPGSKFKRFVDPGLIKFAATEINKIPGAYQMITGYYD